LNSGMKLLLVFLLFGFTVFAGADSADITLLDSKGEKELGCRVHFPPAGEKLPFIVFSHGFGADSTAFAAISQHLAGHGYVIVHPSHADGLNRAGLRRGAAEGEAGGDKSGARRFSGLRNAGGGLAAAISDPAKIEGRVSDVILILDAIEQLVEKLPALRGRIDTSRIGVGGHSFGAYTSMLVGGVTVDLAGQQARGFADPRVRCIMPISAQGTGQQGLTESSWAALKLPMLTMTGSHDQGVGGQGPEWKKEPFKFSPPGDKYLLFIDGANHLSFGGGLGARSSATTEVVKAVALAFWNAYLKDDAEAKASLTSGEVVKPFAGAATIESK
jgi:predicted dienelactone hydrolase